MQAAKEPLFPGGIARTVCLQHHRFQSFYGEDGIYYALLNTGEELQYGNIGIEQVVRLQPALCAFRMNLHIVIFDVYAGGGEYGIIERTESVEVFGIDFGGAVAAHQVILEKDAHFRYKGTSAGMPRCGDLDTRQQVLLAVRTEHADGKLRPGEDDGLVEPFEHEAEGRCCVGHGVRSMKDDKAGVPFVVVADDAYEFAPGIRIHVRRVHGRVELIGVYAERKILEFGHMLL